MATERVSCAAFRHAATLGLVAAIIAGCGSGTPRVPAGAAPTASHSTDGSALQFTKIADLGQTVTSMTPLPDDSGFLVSTRSGSVYRFDRQSVDDYDVMVLDPTPVLELSDRTATEVEQGLLGLAVSDDGTVLYTDYTDRDAALTVEAFPYVAGQSVDESLGHVVLSLPHPHWGHNGGAIVLTGNGDLLVTANGLETWPRAGSVDIADTGRGGEDEVTELGVVRIPKASLALDAVPFTPGRADFVARGLRNPWTMSIDPATGDLWIGDVGESSREEVDRVPAETTPGEPLDFGWPFIEGSTEFRSSGFAGDTRALQPPVLERPHGESVCAIAGGVVYRGAAIPSLVGTYLFGDMCSDEIRGFDQSKDHPQDRAVATAPEPPTAFGQDGSGEVYLLGASGGIYRMDPAGWDPGDLDQRVEPPSSTTTLQPYPAEACGMSAALIAIHGLGAAAPDALRSAYLSVRERYGAVMAQIGPDGELLLRSIDRYIAAGGAADWNVDDPAFREVQDASRDGSGEFEGLPEAISRLFENETASCS